ncbi:MAG: hypothetical protein IAF38_06895 [Bacteroidia bacterium]|nr:hypothetical protein [Bacteroidia bacterium]
MKKVIGKYFIKVFPFFLMLLFSCGENTDQKEKWEFHTPERIEENYWNNYRITQKVLDSCKGIYFPDYFPMSVGYGKLMKIIIPNDTIKYFDLEMQETKGKNGTPVYYFVDKKSKLLFNGDGDYDIPFLTGIFSCDSNQNFLFQDLNTLKKIRKPEELANNPNIHFGMGVEPCLLSYEGRRPYKSQQWKFGIVGNPVFDTLRFNHAGAEINPVLEKMYLEKIKSKRVRANEEIDRTMQAVESHPCLRMEVFYGNGDTTAKSGPGSPFDTDFIIWFERNIGPVKIECKSNGVIYILGKSNGSSNPERNSEYRDNNNSFNRY